MSELFCTKCGKLHESESEFCEYCGYDLKEAIRRFKEKKFSERAEKNKAADHDELKEKELQGMEFYKHIKKTEKRRRQKETDSRFAFFERLLEIPTREEREEGRRRWKENPRRNIILFISIIIGAILLFVVMILIFQLGS